MEILGHDTIGLKGPNDNQLGRVHQTTQKSNFISIMREGPRVTNLEGESQSKVPKQLGTPRVD